MSVISHSIFADAWVVLVTADHDPSVTAVDCPKNSLIINEGWWKKMDDGLTTNVSKLTMGVFNKTSDPTKDDDVDAGYTVGFEWLNSSSDAIFKCIDSTAAGARWLNLVTGVIVGGP